jgi:hypothetical protein
VNAGYCCKFVANTANFRYAGYEGMSSPTAAKGDKRGLDVISRYVMSSEPAAGDKRSALDLLTATFHPPQTLEQKKKRKIPKVWWTISSRFTLLQ